MAQDKPPKHYQRSREKFKDVFDAFENLGRTAREHGPLDKKTSHLIQLAASVANHSEGSVHSHARRAIENGATQDEVSHAVLLLTTTLGFPAVAAALSWVEDVFNQA